MVLIADMTVATLKLLIERGEKMDFNFGDFGEGSLNQRIFIKIKRRHRPPLLKETKK